ncbi:unnamed protein product [Parnassius mnemosyne]|uniref:Reverse transcriptase domain-containing protein n=1 Tax=Parnassius mnemosyne TaxID=213953 RepID=A0AAV1L7C5_9NEOP
MSFGLKNAPATFQKLMNTCLSGLQGSRCFVYLDDIVVYSHDLNSHIQNLASVFSRLRNYNLKLQPDKCEFLCKEVAYLGHLINNDGVKPNPEKLKAISEFPVPKCAKDIISFLGLVSYYRRFIPDFSKLAKPLTSLLKKHTPFCWKNEQQLAFEVLKEKLTTSRVLAYPDFSKPFILTCDASNFAISAILSQGQIGKDHPIAFASRTLNKAECNYSVTEKECLAIVFGTKAFRPYLYGRTFTIVTDHKPLQWLFSCKDPGSRLIRWRLKLEEFDYIIVHKKGKINTNADALSRFPVNPIQYPEPQAPNTQVENYSPPSFDHITPEELERQLPSIPNPDSNETPLIDLLEDIEIPLNNSPILESTNNTNPNPSSSVDPQPSTTDQIFDFDDFGLRDLGAYGDDLNINTDSLNLPTPPPETLPIPPNQLPTPFRHSPIPETSPIPSNQPNLLSSTVPTPEPENEKLNQTQNNNYSQFLKSIHQ